MSPIRTISSNESEKDIDTAKIPFLKWKIQSNKKMILNINMIK